MKKVYAVYGVGCKPCAFDSLEKAKKYITDNTRMSYRYNECGCWVFWDDAGDICKRKEAFIEELIVK